MYYFFSFFIFLPAQKFFTQITFIMKNTQSHQFSLAPLQGVTDFYFRNEFLSFFSAYDISYTPYFRYDNKNSLNKKSLKELDFQQDKQIHIPQIMTNKPDEMLTFANIFNDKGFLEMNWNLGCPYPMVTGKTLGAGMLSKPELIEEILHIYFNETNFPLSIKMRTAYQNDYDYINVLKILNSFPVKNIIIHPRKASQLYKGFASAEDFKACMKISEHTLWYNGDIFNKENFQQKNQEFEHINKWMLGRGLISNPFLIGDIKGVEHTFAQKKSIFNEFHNHLYAHYSEKLEGAGHLLSKMTHLWEYFSKSFSNSQKCYKKIKKSKNIPLFENAVSEIFRNEDWIA